jgi:trigger factor
MTNPATTSDHPWTVEETLSDGLKRSYKITVPADYLSEKQDEELKEIGKDAKLPGFRPGKVPLKVLRKRYGDSVMGKTVEKTISQVASDVLEGEGIRPATQPNIELDDFQPGEDLEYNISVEKLPQVELVDASEIDIEKPVVEPTEDDIQEALDNIAENNQVARPMDADRAAEMGDTVQIDFTGRLAQEDEPRDSMTAEDFNLELGSDMLIDDFEEQLVGAKPGDEVEVTVTFPDEYQAEDMAGKQAVFTVTVKSLMEMETPSGDELAEQVGMESIDDLREKIKDRIVQEYEQVARQRQKRQLLDALDEQYGFNLPESLVESEFESIWEQHLEEQKRIEESDEEPEEEKSEDEWRDDYMELAKRRVRLGLVLSEFGEQHEIEVGEQELRSAIMQRAQQFPGQAQQVFQFFQQNPQAIENLRAPLFEEKVIDFLLELANVSEKTVTKDELMEEPEAPALAGKKKK